MKYSSSNSSQLKKKKEQKKKNKQKISSEEKIAKSFVCSISFPSFHFVLYFCFHFEKTFAFALFFQLIFPLVFLLRSLAVNRFVDFVLFIAFLSRRTSIFGALLFLLPFFFCYFASINSLLCLSFHHAPPFPNVDRCSMNRTKRKNEETKNQQEFFYGFHVKRMPIVTKSALQAFRCVRALRPRRKQYIS